ncbi:MAG: winged helix-turn-helix domain-containing protein [Alphaproteobacteria bacterium]|nr:winged helix-turn-helix domain-containing protein [Alphaproteobacteria bacterium]
MRYLFDDCELDTRRRELRRGGAPVEVAPQVFDLLAHLIGARDRVVSKDDLIAAIWRGRIVSESAMFNRINAARAAIGDSGAGQRLIKTFSRKGVRFIGDVRVAEPAVAEAPRPDRRADAIPLPDRPSLAVLPLADLSGEGGWAHFADGVTEDLITGLARIRWLFVIARNSSFVFRGRRADAKDVARELGVRYVLTGSVRGLGRRLRISVQLIDTATGVQHWAERYDRELGDIFAVQDEITRSVAGAIEPRLLAAEGVRGLGRAPDDLAPWELVARAQTHFWRMSQEDFGAAMVPLRRAVEIQPDYAPARGLLGFSLVFAAHMGWITRAEGVGPGGAHAARAIELDDRDPWGHVALGYCALMERRTADAVAAFARAVSLNPSSAAAHSHLSRGYAFAGRDVEAIRHGEDAIRLSPVDPEMALFLGAIAVAHFTAGRPAEAARFTGEALRLRPGFQGAQRLRAASLALAGQLDEARAQLAVARRRQPELSVAWIRESVPYQTPALLERFIDGMRKAGLED